MTAERHLFPKTERLFLKKDVDRLFANGQSFIAYPLRVIYTTGDRPLRKPEEQTGNAAENASVAILVSVPKKYVKQAVKRNRIKRLIRESYRLNKRPAGDYAQSGQRLHITFMYVCNKPLPYPEIEKAVTKALNKIFKNEATGD